MAEVTAQALPAPVSRGLPFITPQHIGLMFSAATMIAILVAGYLWSQAPDYRVLYGNLPDRDGGAVVASLQQMNIPYKFADGGALMVPAAQIHETRLRLAAVGLPKSGPLGFELMETQKFGVSQFAEQINYQRALEGELSRRRACIWRCPNRPLSCAISPRPAPRCCSIWPPVAPSTARRSAR